MLETYQSTAQMLTKKDKTPVDLFYECCTKEAGQMPSS